MSPSDREERELQTMANQEREISAGKRPRGQLALCSFEGAFRTTDIMAWKTAALYASGYSHR